MRRFLLDTGIASDYINRRNKVYDRARDQTRLGNVIGICVPVLGELFYGAENSAFRDRMIQQIYLAIPSWRIWPYTQAAAAEYGRLAAELKRIGRPMQQIDIQIAAIALSLGSCTVVSTDSDLAAVPGLTVENWAGP
jgi:tRNA(fMet)-specific endonuclease VapC